ncbi:MAG: hypothetical protein QF380_07085 [Candidatus Marinimicrobia bacterium]|nr:hypothetical protein [Candidatus Neomarinimicrobiota bacterium]
MAGIIQIITLILLSLVMMSSSCDKGLEGCTDLDACNYDDTAAIDDNSCWFASEGCDCNDPSGSIIDCLEICDADATNDPPLNSEGYCCTSLDEYGCDEIVVGGCIEEENCDYDSNATHNDGTCAADLSEFGGLPDGNDCNNECGGFAVKDECDLCIGGSTNLGHSWRIKINSIATFKLQDGTSMGADTNSVTLGTSIYALDGYNGTEMGEGDASCDNCHIDLPEPPFTLIDEGKNSIRFYFPHNNDADWDDWGSQVNPNLIPVLQFDSDIRAIDYQSLFLVGKGMEWFAEIESTISDTIIIVNEIPETYESVMDSIYFQITHLEGIKCSQIKIAIDREEGAVVSTYDYVIENNQLGILVDTIDKVTVTINISNICIREQVYESGNDFVETCPYKN